MQKHGAGTTTGLGYVAARTAVRHGAYLIALNRASERADTAASVLQEEAKPRPNAVKAVECNLASFASVRAAAAQVLAATEQTGINVLVCNAGAHHC